MNKAELIDSIAEKTGEKYTKTMIQDIIDIEKTVIKETVAKGEEVKLVGFGTFEARKQAARTIKTPKQQIINVSAKMAPKFSASKDFKDQVEQLEVK